MTQLELDVLAELLHNKLITTEPITPTRGLIVHRSRAEPLWVDMANVPRSRTSSTRYLRLMNPVRFQHPDPVFLALTHAELPFPT